VIGGEEHRQVLPIGAVEHDVIRNHLHVGNGLLLNRQQAIPDHVECRHGIPVGGECAGIWVIHGEVDDLPVFEGDGMGDGISGGGRHRWWVGTPRFYGGGGVVGKGMG